MIKASKKIIHSMLHYDSLQAVAVVILAAFMLFSPTFGLAAEAGYLKTITDRLEPDTITSEPPVMLPNYSANDSVKIKNSYSQPAFVDGEILVKMPEDTTKTIVVDPNNPYGLTEKIPFNPNPERAVWLSALFPGLGQIYNRRYWKLPIILGGFMGLGYATSWNNNQLQEYSQAYRDLMDNDPATNSYMNFFPPNTSESSLDKTWLTSTLQSRRNFYRRNRDLCIISLVALYLLCMVDAYVDASMAHFDISPDLSMDVAPAMFISPGSRRPAVGLNWAFNF